MRAGAGDRVGAALLHQHGAAVAALRENAHHVVGESIVADVRGDTYVDGVFLCVAGVRKSGGKIVCVDPLATELKLPAWGDHHLGMLGVRHVPPRGAAIRQKRRHGQRKECAGFHGLDFTISRGLVLGKSAY